MSFGKVKSLAENFKFQLFLICILTFAVYANTLSNQFVFDDVTFSNWTLVRSLENLPALLKGALPEPHYGDFRPTKGVILALDYKFWGLNVVGYHLQAIAIHITATILVYLIAFKIAKSRMVAFLTGLFFGLHPIHTEAITFITSSTDILGVVLFFASFLLYLKFLDEGRGRNKFLILSLVFSFFAYLVYELVLVLPLVIIFYDFCFENLRIKNLQDRWKRYALYFGVIVLYLIIRFLVLGVFKEQEYLGDSFFLTILAMAKVFLKYVWLLIYPFNLNVNHTISEGIFANGNFDSDFRLVTGQSFLEGQVLAGFGVLTGMLASAFYFFKRAPLITFSVGWFFMTLLAVSNILPISFLMAERYLYAASFAFCLLLAWGFRLSWERGFLRLPLRLVRPGIIAAVLILVFFYSFGTIKRNFDWRDNFTLWSRAAQGSPGSAMVLGNLASAYSEDGDYDKAIPLFEAAVEAKPDNSRVHVNLGIVNVKKGEWEKANSSFNNALRLDQNQPVARYWKGVIYEKQGMVDLAKEEYERSLVFDPNNYDAHINLGLIYMGEGKLDLAQQLFKRATVIERTYFAAYNNLAILYAQQGRYDLAIEQLKEALAIDPTNETLLENLRILETYQNGKN